MSDDELQRLHDRVDRERRARRQAEAIAAQGMKDLWEVNRNLQERVAANTAVTDAFAQATELAARHLVASTAEELGAVLDEFGSDGPLSRLRELHGRLATTATSEPVATVACHPSAVGDRLLARWQLPAARRRQLLSVEISGQDGVAGGAWAPLVAAAELAIRMLLTEGAPGPLTVRIVLGTDSIGVEVSATVSGAAANDLPESARRSLTSLATGTGGTARLQQDGSQFEFRAEWPRTSGDGSHPTSA